jgi:hypothetical protein
VVQVSVEKELTALREIANFHKAAKAVVHPQNNGIIHEDFYPLVLFTYDTYADKAVDGTATTKARPANSYFFDSLEVVRKAAAHRSVYYRLCETYEEFSSLCDVNTSDAGIYQGIDYRHWAAFPELRVFPITTLNAALQIRGYQLSYTGKLYRQVFR